MNSTAKKILQISGVLVLFIIIWHLISLFYDPYLLPSPLEVYQRYLRLVEGGGLFHHLWATFAEAFGGFLVGTLLALPCGYFMYRCPLLDRIMTPFVVGIQAVPIVALAPLLVIWFGFGIISKVLIAALVTFFPIVTNVVIGLKNIDPKLRELLKIMGADSNEVFWKLEVPSSLPVLFGGMKIGLTLAVIGAVVGEFAGSGVGLGYLVNLAKGMMDTPLIFVGLIFLALLGLSFYSVLSWAEFRLMPWKAKK